MDFDAHTSGDDVIVMPNRLPTTGTWARPLRRALATAAVAALALAACNGDDDPPAGTSATPTTATQPTSPPTSQPTTQLSPPATDATPATTPPTAAPTSVPEPPPTTAEPDTATVDDVVAALVESRRLLDDALLDPTDDAKAQAASAMYAGDALDRVANLIAGYRADGTAEVTSTDNPSRVVPYDETVVIDGEAGTASLQYCFVNSNLTVEVGGSPDGSDRVLDDRVIINLERDDFALLDGRWKVVDGAILTTYEGVDECPEQP